MPESPGESTTLQATFRSYADALAAREAVLVASPRATLDEPSPVTDSGFIMRFLVIVAVASIAGTALGVAIGFSFIAAGITPDTTESLVLQTVTWAIFWHLLIGMIAGYVLLADRSRSEWSPTAGKKATLSVACTDPDTVQRVSEVLRNAGATGIEITGGQASA